MLIGLSSALKMGVRSVSLNPQSRRDDFSIAIQGIFQKEGVWVLGDKPQLLTTLATRRYHYFCHVHSTFYIKYFKNIKGPRNDGNAIFL